MELFRSPFLSGGEKGKKKKKNRLKNIPESMGDRSRSFWRLLLSPPTFFPPSNVFICCAAWIISLYTISLSQQGKASGNKAALWLRTKLQWHLFHLGRFVQRHAGKVLFVGLLVLSTFCVGLKSASIQTDVEKLWVEGKKKTKRQQQRLLPRSVTPCCTY